MKKKVAYGLKLDGENLSWLSVERQDQERWRLEGHGQVALDAVAMPIAVDGFPGPQQLGMGILPGTKVKTAISRLPRFRGKAMDRAVKGWAACEENVQADELALTWSVIEDAQESKNDMVNVFMAYTAQSTIDESMATFERAGLEPNVMLPDFMILDQYLRSTWPELVDLQAWSTVHLDKSGSFVSIASDQSLLMHRALPQDHSNGADDTDYVQRLATEISRSLSFARQTEQNPGIGNIFISGETHLVDLLSAELQSSQHLPVTPWSVTDLFETDSSALGTETLVPLAGAVLSALGDSRFNLLPTARRSLLSACARRRLSRGMAATMAIAVPAFVVMSLAAEHKSAGRLEQARARWDAVAPAIEAATEADQQLRLALEREKVIADHTAGADGLEDLLVDLAVSTPPQIRFESLKIVRNGDSTILQLSGVSTDDQNAGAQQAFLSFVATLDESESLVRTKQPGKLTIGEVKKDESQSKRVIFSLEYLVDTNKRREA